MSRPKEDKHLAMTEDDLRAARVFTLAVKFFGAGGPLASSDIHLDLYPGLDDGSFARQFLRDRELLATFGISICEVDDGAADTLWRVDEGSSYVQDDVLSATDARLLYVMCHDLAFDPSFPYRYELRMALAKMANMCHGTTFAQSDKTTPQENKLLSVLVGCMSNHHAVSVSYTDAKGTTSTRKLAILGSFGLREHTYFVAARVKQSGELEDGSIRTYRLDRFGKAKALDAITYQVPEDFSVQDYEHLPFQIGDTIGTAQYVVPAETGSHLAHAVAGYGTVCEQDGQTLWEVSFADTDLAAAWAAGERLRPLAPAELVAAWQIICSATSAAYDASLATLIDEKGPTAPRKRAGRKGSIATTRQLVALACNLTREGEVITAESIATSLGISFDDARHLIALLSMGSGESIDYLPVILSDDDDEVALMEGAQLSSKRIRLTRAETIALMAALSKLGVSADDPLVQTLSQAYATPSFSSEDLAQTLDTEQPITAFDVLKQCHDAITKGDSLRFRYRPVSGDAESERHVIPQNVRHKEDNWYLEAFDLDKQGQRIFRLDRMSNLAAVSSTAGISPAKSTNSDQTEFVVVRFDDNRYLTLFPWDDLQVIDSADDTTTVRMPNYEGDWLARHLAACMPHVHVSSAELAQQMQSYLAAIGA